MQRRIDVGEERNDLGIDIIGALIFKNAVDTAAGVEDCLLTGTNDQTAAFLDLTIFPFVEQYIGAVFDPLHCIFFLIKKSHYSSPFPGVAYQSPPQS